MLRHRLLLIAVGGVAIVTAASFATAGQSRPTATRVIASATTNDFRIVLTATRSGTGSAASADVTIATSRRVGGDWRPTGQRRVPGPYFWNTVTGPRVVCRLEIRTAASRPRTFRPYVTVQLLLTPSLGCGPAHRYRLKGGG